MSNVNNSFFSALGLTIADSDLAKKNGLSYIAAASASKLAGRPEIHFVDFGDQPYLECFGGSLVAVDLELPGSTIVQRTWLPVMDQDNQALTLAKTTLSDINNSRQRCLVKAIASVYGHGMSLYLGCDGDGAKAVKMLGVSPETDLAVVPPVVALLKEGGAGYVEWGVGLSACRVTDAEFYWEVLSWDYRPYRQVLDSILVDVSVIYQGKRQVLSLPIMDSTFKAIPADKVSVFDWNKTVMRALTKAIAFRSGYGLSVYADDFGSSAMDAKAKTKAAKPTPAAEAKLAREKAAAEAAIAAAAAAVVEAPADAVVDTPAAEVVVDAAPAEVPATPEAAPAAEVVVDAAPAEVPATPEAAPAAESVATSTSALPAEVAARFQRVMQSRRDVAGTAGLISLFQALNDSTKFADEDKPGCYAMLLTAAASVVDGEHIYALVDAISQFRAVRFLAVDQVEIVTARIVAEMLHYACDTSDEALAAAPASLIAAGIAADVAQVIALAKAGNTTTETLDLLVNVLDISA